jgi:hypothetical protein
MSDSTELVNVRIRESKSHPGKYRAKPTSGDDRESFLLTEQELLDVLYRHNERLLKGIKKKQAQAVLNFVMNDYRRRLLRSEVLHAQVSQLNSDLGFCSFVSKKGSAPQTKEAVIMSKKTKEQKRKLLARLNDEQRDELRGAFRHLVDKIPRRYGLCNFGLKWERGDEIELQISDSTGDTYTTMVHFNDEVDAEAADAFLETIASEE